MLHYLISYLKNKFISPKVWHESKPPKVAIFSAWVISYCGVCTQETYLPYVEYLDDIGFVFYDIKDGHVDYHYPKKLEDYQMKILYWSPHKVLPNNAYKEAKALGGGDRKTSKPNDTPRPHPRMKRA